MLGGMGICCGRLGLLFVAGFPSFHVVITVVLVFFRYFVCVNFVFYACCGRYFS